MSEARSRVVGGGSPRPPELTYRPIGICIRLPFSVGQLTSCSIWRVSRPCVHPARTTRRHTISRPIMRALAALALLLVLLQVRQQEILIECAGARMKSVSHARSVSLRFRCA